MRRSKDKKPEYRAFPLSVEHLTEHKRRVIAAILESYRAAVNFYIRSVWTNGGKLDGPTLARLSSTRLTERYKSQALNQALGMIKGARKSAKELGIAAGMPHCRTDGADLDAKLVKVEASMGLPEPAAPTKSKNGDRKNLKNFDFVVRLSTLVKRDVVMLPLKATTPLRECLAKPGARLVQGVNLSEDRITFIVELPYQELPPPDENSRILGIDVGYTKLIATSEGCFLGTDFPEISSRIRRRKPGSKGKKRALRARDQAVGEAVNKLPWDEFDVLGLENLKGIKFGKRKGQAKTWRRKRASWPATAVQERVERRAVELAKRVTVVDPRGTSITCPECGHVDKKNRVRGVFRCVKCEYMNDADYVGSLNVKTKTKDALWEERVFGPAKPVVKKKNNRRGVVSGIAIAVVSTQQSEAGGSASPASVSKSALRDARVYSRSDTPDSHEPGQRGCAVRGRGAVRGVKKHSKSTTSSGNSGDRIESLGRANRRTRSGGAKR